MMKNWRKHLKTVKESKMYHDTVHNAIARIQATRKDSDQTARIRRLI